MEELHDLLEDRPIDTALNAKLEQIAAERELAHQQAALDDPDFDVSTGELKQQLEQLAYEHRVLTKQISEMDSQLFEAFYGQENKNGVEKTVVIDGLKAELKQLREALELNRKMKGMIAEKINEAANAREV